MHYAMVDSLRKVQIPFVSDDIIPVSLEISGELLYVLLKFISLFS